MNPRPMFSGARAQRPPHGPDLGPSPATNLRVKAVGLRKKTSALGRRVWGLKSCSYVNVFVLYHFRATSTAIVIIRIM